VISSIAADVIDSICMVFFYDAQRSHLMFTVFLILFAFDTQFSVVFLMANVPEETLMGF